MSTDNPRSCELLRTLEERLLSDPTDAGGWLVYFDCCLERGLGVDALVPLVSSAPEVRLEREPGFDLVVEVPDPESRCTIQIRLAPAEPGAPGRTLSARFRRKMPPLDWLVSYPWPVTI